MTRFLLRLLLLSVFFNTAIGLPAHEAKHLPNLGEVVAGWQASTATASRRTTACIELCEWCHAHAQAFAPIARRTCRAVRRFPRRTASPPRHRTPSSDPPGPGRSPRATPARLIPPPRSRRVSPHPRHGPVRTEPGAAPVHSLRAEGPRAAPFLVRCHETPSFVPRRTPLSHALVWSALLTPHAHGAQTAAADTPQLAPVSVTGRTAPQGLVADEASGAKTDLPFANCRNPCAW